MSKFFEPSLDGAYPTMAIYGGPLYADFLGPFYRNESGGSFPTTSSTVSSDSVPPPGWEDKTVQDLQDIWQDSEESLSGKYTSIVEREDVPQIEELARLFVFRAKTSPRWLPYYTGLSPTETPCPELQVQATESPGATPTHDDIRVLARDDEMQDVEDWLNAAPDLDISSMLQEAGCDLFSCCVGENMSVATSTGQFTSGQTSEDDRSVLIGCEEPQSSPGWEDKKVQDLQDIWMDQEQSLSSKYTSIVEREDVQQIEELARMFVFRAKTSPRWLPYYTGLSPTETPCPELQVQATESPGATPTHDDIRVLARDDEMQDVEDWLNAAPDLDISSMLQEAGCDLFSCSDGENMSAASSTGQFTSGQTSEDDSSVLIGCEEPHDLDISSVLQEAGCDLFSCSDGENMSVATCTGQFTSGQTPDGDRSVLIPCEKPQSSSGWEDKTVHDLQDIWMDQKESYHSTVERDDVQQIEELARLFVFRAKTSPRWLPYYTGLSPTETPCPELQVQATESPVATPTHDDIRVLARDDEMQDVEDWLNAAPDLDISSMLQEAGCDLFSCYGGENMSAATSTGQFTSGQTPEGDRPVLIGCEELQSSQCITSFIKEDDIVDLATTTNDSLAEQPLRRLPFECQSPVNTPKPSSPAAELLLTPVYDDACAHYPDQPSCAEEPPFLKCTCLQRDDWAMIETVATMFVFHAKHSPRHVPYYTCQSPAGTTPSTPRLAAEESWVNPYFTCQSPAGTPPPTPRLAAEESWVHEDVQSLAKRAEEEDIADWVNGMCGTGEDVQGLAKKVDQDDTQEFVHEMCDNRSAPATLMHQDIQGLAKKVDREDTKEFGKETCGDQSTPTTLMHQDALSKIDDKEEIQDFVNGDQSTSTTLMHQGKDLQDLSKEADKEDPQDFVNKTCGDRATPTTPTHKGEDVNDLAKKVVKENPQDLVQTTPTALLHQDAQGLEKVEQDNSVVTDMCGASHQMVPTTLTGQAEDIQAKTVDKEDQGNMVTERETKAQTDDEPQKREGKWWDLRIKREKMATDRTGGSNDEKKDAKEGRKWWRRIFTRKSGGKTSGNDNEASSRKSRWKIFRKKQLHEKGLKDGRTTTESKTNWWKRGSKKTGNSKTDLYEGTHLEDTILVVFSDHGPSTLIKSGPL
ncbi:Hypp1180 [Branchiostoma lanceolatum]|uniref:Hypp1180 protein n=1 Tax=Branchiostoma lanceolatum TaxID=7740 RepID=A0A8K0ELU0_BRALA|nr:Hypp1180 [Branchiostoma lanceolatum]